jgi:hypothetical protein
MGLETRVEENLYAFMQSVVDPEPLAPEPGSTGFRGWAYYDRLDRNYCAAANKFSSHREWGYCDPLYLDGSKPATNWDLGIAIGDIKSLQVGEWDKANARQRLYTWDSGLATAKLVELDPITLLPIDGDPFPNVRLECSTVVSPNDGYYYIGGQRDCILFETQGYLIAPYAVALRWNGGTSYPNSSVKVDLSTGAGEPVAGLYGRAWASPHAYGEPEVHGDTFYWQFCQFVPDDDSTPIYPKGFLWWTAPGRQVGGAANANQYVWCRKIEWNPNGLDGTPSRVHLREILTSRLEFDETVPDSPTGYQHTGRPFIYHGPSDQIYTMGGQFNDPTDTDGKFLYKFATVPGVDSITAASWTKLPQTAATVPFFVTVLGTLGEPVAGVDVSWELERVSEVDERFDGAVVGVGGTHTLDEGPADSGTISVIEDPDGAATLLTAGVHYNVTGGGGGTGVQGIGPTYWQAETYAVFYEHKATALSPAHGTLLDSVSQSDVTGEATCRVRYPDDDDLVGAYDQLSADTP